MDLAKQTVRLAQPARRQGESGHQQWARKGRQWTLGPAPNFDAFLGGLDTRFARKLSAQPWISIQLKPLESFHKLESVLNI